MTDCPEATADGETAARLQLLWITGAEAFLRAVPPVLPSSAPETAAARPVDAETAGAALRVLDGATAVLAASGAGRALCAGGRFVPLVAAVLTSLLQVAQRHYDRALRLACLATLGRTLALVADARVLAAVLPGVSTTLAAIATGDYKQGRRVTAAALRCWAALVGAVCADTVLAPAGAQPSAAAWLRTAGEQLAAMAARLFAPAGRGVPRTDAPDVRLALVDAARTVACRCTRLAARGGALVPALDCLVLHADDTDAAVAADATTALADLAARDQEEDSDGGGDDLARAARVLAALGREIETGAGEEDKAQEPSLHRVMAERLQRALVELEGVVAYALADEQAVAAVRTVAGYVALLRARLGAIMPGVVATLVPALVALIEVDGPHPTTAATPASPVAVAMLQPARTTLLPAVPAVLVDTHSAVLNSASRPSPPAHHQQAPQQQDMVAFAASAGVAEGVLSAVAEAAAEAAEDADAWGDNGYPPLPLRHFGDARVCREVRRLCGLLGAHDASGLFCSELEACARGLADAGAGTPTAPEVATLLTAAVVGACRARRRPRSALRACAQLVLDLHAACGGPLLGAVVARAVGDLCCCDGDGDDEEEDEATLLLREVLYPVLELLGDGTRAPAGPLLASAARTLARLARGAHTSVAGLVAAHADALTDAVARRLRAPDHRARAPFVFRALLHVAGAAFVPLVRDTLGAALRALRAGSLLAGADMLAVLDEVALAMARVGTRAVDDDEDGEDDSDSDHLTAAALREDLRKQLALRHALEAPARESENDPLRGLTGEARIAAIKQYMTEHAQAHSSTEKEKEEEEKEEEEDTLGPRLLDEDEQRVVLLGRVLETAVPYVSSASAAVCVQALGVLEHGIGAMVANGGGARGRGRDRDSSPPLWPLLHRCCRPLLRRVQDAGAPTAVALRAAEVLARVLHAGRAFLVAEPPAALAALTARLRDAAAAAPHRTRDVARVLACVAHVAGRGGCAVPRAARRAAFDACAAVLGVAPAAAEDTLAALARADAPAAWAWCSARLADAADDDSARAALSRIAVLCTEVDDP